MGDDYAYDDNIRDTPVFREDDAFRGMPIPIEHPFLLSFDIERFIMSLPEDETRVLIVRMMGYEGKKAAELGGFRSIWSYIRKLKKLQARARAQIGEAFQL